MKILAGILMSLYLGLTLLGLYQYKAHNRSWGMKLVVWMSGVVLLVGVTARLVVCLESSLPLFLIAGFCLAYFVGWRIIGRRFTGWRQHLVRGLAFALCLGPIAAVRLSELGDFQDWLGALADMPFTDMLKLTLYGLPGFFLVGAVGFLDSAEREIATKRTEKRPTIAVSRRAKLGYSLLLLMLLLSVNWYIAGMLRIYVCAEDGDRTILNYIRWSRPGSVNAKDPDGRTPLHWAAFYGQTEAIKVLIEVGAKINARDWRGATPLYEAAYRGQTEAANTLIEAGANINARNDESRMTPLAVAAGQGSTEVCKLLIEAGAKVNPKDEDSWTPLHKAVYGGHTETTKILLAAGANVNAKNKYGITALNWAAYQGHTEVAKTLLKAGAKVNPKDEDSWTPLHQAARCGHTEVVKILLKAGAKVNAKDGGNGQTPLHWATLSSDAKTVTVLIQARANVNAKDSAGKTPLDMTKDNSDWTDLKERAKCVALLLKHGAKTGKKLDAEAKQSNE